MNQDIGQLVRDTELIRIILKSLKGTLPEPLEEALHPAAYIESHQISVLKAQKRLSGSTKADSKEIQDADDIRLRVISVIQNALGSL